MTNCVIKYVSSNESMANCIAFCRLEQRGVQVHFPYKKAEKQDSCCDQISVFLPCFSVFNLRYTRELLECTVFTHLIFWPMASKYAAFSSSYITRCKSVNELNGESSFRRDEAGTTYKGISFLIYSAPLPTTERSQIEFEKQGNVGKDNDEREK